MLSSDVFSRPAEFDEVEDAVFVLQTERGRLCLVHRRCQGCRDALPDESDEKAVAVRAPQETLSLRRHDADAPVFAAWRCWYWAARRTGALSAP